MRFTPQRPRGRVLVAGTAGIARWAGHALGRASKNLGRGVSRGHIQKHFHRYAKSAGRTIFRKPKNAPRLIESVLREGQELAIRHADDLAAGKLVRNATTEAVQGNQWVQVISKFDHPVGAKGERFLLVLVRKSGQMTTAYPVAAALSAGAFFGITGLGSARAHAMYDDFGDHVAMTADAVARVQQRGASPWWNELIGFLDPSGIFYSEPVNGAEARALAINRGVNGALRAIERRSGRRLSRPEREVFANRFMDALKIALNLRD